MDKSPTLRCCQIVSYLTQKLLMSFKKTLEMLLQQNWGSTCWIFGCRIWKQSYRET